MQKKLTLSEHITNYIMALVYCIAVFNIFLSSSTLKLDLSTSFLLVVSGVTIFFFLFVNKYVFRFLMLGLLAFIIFAAVYIFFESGLDGILVVFTKIYSDLFYLITTATSFTSKETFTICLIIALFYSAYSVLFIVRHTNFFALLILGLVMLIMQLITNNFKSEFPYIWFSVVLCIMATYHIYEKTKKTSATLISSYSFIFFVFPIIAIIVSISIFLPYNSEYNVIYDLKYLNMNSYYNSGEGNFSLSKSGFGENDKQLGGSITLDETKVLKVFSDRPYYITGNVKDTYDGKAWSSSSDQKEKLTNNPLFDTSQTLNALATYLPRKINLNDSEYGLSFSTSQDEDFFDEDNETLSDEKLKELLSSQYFNIYDDAEIRIDPETNQKIINDSNGNILFSYSPDKPDITSILDLSDINTSPLTPEEIKKASTLKTSTVVYSNLSLRTLLRHSKFFSMDTFPPNYQLWKDDAGSLYSGRYMTNNFEYTYSYLDINRDIYEKLIRYNFLIPASNSATPIEDYHLDNYTSDNSFDYNIYLHNICTSLPDNYSDRVYELSQIITSRYGLNYDKALALEKFLKTHYTYSLDGEIPPNEDDDFVDYFLFESKSGYCTYFASAMAVMARCVGLPSRYVEGFSIDGSAANTDFYDVKNSDAHAWTEIYFEGVGWVPFEPTSGFELNSSNQPSASQPSVSSGLSSDTTEEDTDSRNNDSVSKYILLVIFIILILIALLFIYCSLRYYFINKKIKNIIFISDTLAVIAYFKETSKLLAICDTPIPFNSTLFDFAKINNKTYSFNKYTLLHFCEIYNKACFSKHTITPNELFYVKSYYLLMHDFSEEKLGKIKFFIRRYIKPPKK